MSRSGYRVPVAVAVSSNTEMPSLLVSASSAPNPSTPTATGETTHALYPYVPEMWFVGGTSPSAAAGLANASTPLTPSATSSSRVAGDGASTASSDSAVEPALASGAFADEVTSVAVPLSDSFCVSPCGQPATFRSIAANTAA